MHKFEEVNGQTCTETVSPARPSRTEPRSYQRRVKSAQKSGKDFCLSENVASTKHDTNTQHSRKVQSAQKIQVRSNKVTSVMPCQIDEFAESFLHKSSVNAYGAKAPVRVDFSPTASYMREVMRFRAKHASLQDKVAYFNES